MSLLQALPLLSAPALGEPLPEGWRFGADLRLRGEYLENSFRPLAPPADRVLATRIRVHAGYRSGALSGELELQDSRIFGDERLSPLGTDDVNALEPLQAWVGWELRRGLELRLGRQTIDHAARRVIARNRFRNTSNSFTGIRLRASMDTGAEFEAFHLYPDERRPDIRDRAALRGNEARPDPIAELGRFSGFTVADAALGNHWQLDSYLLLRGVDDSPLGIGDRDHLTGGLRLRHESAGWRAEVEGAFQYGKARAEPLPGASMVDHRAWFLHAGLRRDLPFAGVPQLHLRFDAFSGDDDPADARSGRFDKLFGARASELGPSGIYGLFDRSNLISPAASLSIPGEHLDLLIGYRAGWLESKRDFLPSAGLRDRSGGSGDFLGHQWEAQLTLRPLPAVELVLGGVYLEKGAFLRRAPGASHSGDSRYLWLSASYRF